MKKIISLLLLGLLSLGSLTFFLWQNLKNDEVALSILHLSLDNAVESLDPVKAYSDDSLVISTQVLEPLYQYHYLKRPYEVQPLVAEGLPVISQNGKLITIKLKQGIKYHPHPALAEGRELLAEDFVIQFKRIALESLQSPGRSLFSNLVLGFDEYSKAVEDNWKNIPKVSMPGIRAIDQHTLEFKLSRQENNFIYYLALNFLTPVPWELVEHHQNDLSKILVGTGPYVFSKFKNDYYEMLRFKDYRQDFYPSSGDRYANVQNLLNSSKEKIPFVDQVRFYINVDENERWRKLINHEIDLLNVPKTLIPKLYDSNGELNKELKSASIELKHFPILANRWLGFNMRDPIVGKNKYLRLAIAYSIDYDQYIKTLSQNTNLRANSILVPGISGYLPAKEFRFTYNPEKAKEYLKLAGLTKEENMPTIVYSTRGNQTINLVEANLIKKNLEDIGLKVQVEILTFSEFLKKGRAGELMFFTDNWLFDFPDGENIMQLLVSTNFPGINKSAYSNPRIDSLYSKLKEVSNVEARDKIYQEMEEIIFEDLPWIPLMYESSFVLQYPEIKNFRKSSIIRNYVKYLKIEK
ncbi:MAG: ABC transporter substrate-binding protein [Bacteriovoracaceae bacterium]